MKAVFKSKRKRAIEDRAFQYINQWEERHPEMKYKKWDEFGSAEKESMREYVEKLSQEFHLPIPRCMAFLKHTFELYGPVTDANFLMENKTVVKINEEIIRQIVAESLSDMLSESKQGLQSQKLFDIFKEYGRTGKFGHWTSSEGMDLHNVKDEDVVGVFSYNEAGKNEGEDIKFAKRHGYDLGPTDSIRRIDLKKLDDNGNKQFAMVINRNANFDRRDNAPEGGFKDLVAKQNQRFKNRYPDGGKFYQWKNGNNISSLVFQNPYYKKWTKKAKNDMQQKIKDIYGPDRFNKAKDNRE